MFNQDEEKMECAVGNREMGFWQYKKAEIVLISFLTSGFAAFFCLWLLVLPNLNNLINHVFIPSKASGFRNHMGGGEGSKSYGHVRNYYLFYTFSHIV